jgi:phosphoglycerol transferase
MVLPLEAVEVPALGGVDEAQSKPTPGWLLWLRDLGIVGGAAALIAAVLFRVWSWPLSVPFTYQGDSIGMMAFVKMVDQTGWYTGTARAGAPFGLNTYDWPYGGDNGWWVITKVITWFTDNAATATNLLFLLGFVLVALSAFVALRMVGVSRLVSGTLALVYAFAPWHFLRTTGQLFIGAPVSVPLACALAVLILRGETPFFQSRRAIVGTVAICIVLAVFDPYFTVFGVLIILAAGALRAGATRAWKPLLSAVLVTAVTGVVLVLNLVPSLLYRRSHGLNPEAVVRPIEDLDRYALRPIELLAPVPDHRLSPLAHLSELLTRPGEQSEPYQYLGLVAVIGLAVAVVSLLVWAAGRRGPRVTDGVGPGVLVVILGAFAVMGGLSWLAFTAGLAQIRSWNRVAVVMAFLGLVALSPWLDAGVRRLRARKWAPVVLAGLAVVVVGLALFDQIGKGLVPDPRQNEAEWNNDAQFVSAIEQQLPAGAMVYELPYLPWPEGPGSVAITNQDPWRGFLHSDQLRWSFAGMRGRQADWQEYTTRQPAPDMVDAVTAAGFDGIYLDRNGYTDRTIENGIAGALGGTAPLVSGNGRFAFYDLRPHRAELEAKLGGDGVTRLGNETLHRPRVEYRDGFAPRTFASLDVEHGARQQNRLLVVNETGAPFTGQLLFNAASYSPGEHQLTVRTPSGEQRLTITPNGAAYSVPIVLAPGDNTVTMTTDAPEVPVGYRDLAFNLVNAFIVGA